MANATDYLENKIVDHLFRTATWAKPAALYVGLFTAAPSDAGGGTEVAGGGYARVNRPPVDANWTAPAAGTGQTANVAPITYPAPTADWGTVSHYVIFDAATGGNPIVWGPLTAPRTILNGEPPPLFPAGAIQITVA